MRILLGVTLVFAALWFVALRPKPVEEPAAPAAQNGIVAAPAAAEGAAATSDQANAAVQDADPADAAAGTPAAPAADPAPAPTAPGAAPLEARSAPGATSAGAEVSDPTDTENRGDVARVEADLAARKVLVLLVWDRRASDDREARRAFDAVNTRGGKVRTHLVPVEALSRYDAIFRGLPIRHVPTSVVVDRDRQATLIAGLTVTRELDEAVSRALRD